MRSGIARGATMAPGLWRRPGLVLAMVMVSTLGLSGRAAHVKAADTCVQEAQEDPSADLQAFSGAACIAGTLPDGDRDAYLLELSDEAAARRWMFELSAVPTTRTWLTVSMVTSGPDVRPPIAGNPILELEDAASAAALPTPAPAVPSAGATGASGTDGAMPSTTRELILSPGRYVLGIRRSTGPGGRTPAELGYRLEVREGRPLPPLADVEPNDDAATASSVDGSFEAAGDLQGSMDAYAWTIPPGQGGRFWDLDLEAQLGERMTLELDGDDGRAIAIQNPYESHAGLVDLALEPRTYIVKVGPRLDRPARYVLAATPHDVPVGDPEPNGAPAVALPIGPVSTAVSVEGRLGTPNDEDFYRLDVDETLAGSLVDVTLDRADGSGSIQLCLLDGQGTEVQCRSASRGAVLANLRLGVGSWLLRIRGDADPTRPYQLGVAVVGPVLASAEAEPNDGPSSATRLDPALRLVARLPNEDLDSVVVDPGPEPGLFQLDARGRGIRRLAWVGPDGAELAFGQVARDGTSAVLTDLFLIPGDHWFQIWGADGDYALSLTSLGPPDPAAEREPNADVLHSLPLTIGERRTGRLVPADMDVWRFALDAEEHVAVRLEPPADGVFDVRLTTGAGTVVSRQGAAAQGVPWVYDASLPAGDYELTLAPRTPSEGTYALVVERLDPFVGPAEDPFGSWGEPIPAAPVPLPVDLRLDVDDPGVAAWWPAGQALTGLLTITNRGAAETHLALDWHVSHHLWTVAGQPAVDVPFGGTIDVPVTLRAQPDLPADVPVSLTVRARDALGAQSTAAVEVVPDRLARPASPTVAWPLPAELLGGLDAASLAQGAVPVGGVDPNGETGLHDGITPTSLGLQARFAGAVTLGVDLAGDDPVPVAGTIIDPRAGAPGVFGMPRAFRLLLSDDGVDFHEVLAGELASLPIEQPFALQEPIPARFARLVIESVYGSVDRVRLGEWKVVAAPGWALPGEVELADPIVGGHVVWMDPQPPTPPSRDQLLTFTEAMLDADATRQALPAAAGVRPTWVVGFAHDRAAGITEIRWLDAPAGRPDTRITRVQVSASPESPLGPWQDLGAWELGPSDRAAVAPFVLPAGTWARFVRFVATGLPDGETEWEMPADISVIERPSDTTYRSVLGEWGKDARRGPYEWLAPSGAASDIDSVEVADAGDSAETAARLGPGAKASGWVQRDVDVDVYALTVPSDHDTLRLEVGGTPSVGVGVSLLDATGAVVPLTQAQESPAGRVEWLASVEPGATYQVRVEQPVSSTAFTFDTSGSIGPYVDNIEQGLRDFVAGVTPGQEAVLIVPFEAPPLLAEWSDQPYLLASAVNAYLKRSESSAAETGLLDSLTALGPRQGARAILVITDGETLSADRTAELWKALATVRPTIMAIHVNPPPGTWTAPVEPVRGRQRLQDWAAAAGGVYRYAGSQTELAQAFDQLATWLRRPAAYTLSFVTELAPPPVPGRLRVVAPTDGGATPVTSPDVAVELILDTSGSMLERLAGKRRIDAAKQALRGLVRDALPAGVPLAMRTFGDRRESCATELAVPLGPLDPDTLLDVIDGLRIRKGVQTPIADALGHVADDLAGVEGPKIVVLVTDGEETCEGDPVAAIIALRDAGVDVQVNIVGFAVGGDAELQAQLRDWAALGAGSYFDAGGAQELGDALGRAVRAPFRVYDASGTEVARGTVDGDPVRLDPGTYRVEVLTDPVRTFEEVVVEPGGSLRLTLDGA